VLILKIRQAEVALSDGRLDEVAELLKSERLRSHRRGQTIVTKLVRKLVARGQEHLEASRPMQALTDCEKAARFESNLPEVIELRTAATNAIQSKQRAERRANRALVAAREHVEAGRLGTGERFLAAVAGAFQESRAAMLVQDVNLRRSMIESQIQSAQAALERDDLDVAGVELAKARNTDATDARVVDLAFRICKAIKQKIGSSIDEGRLDLAESLLGKLMVLDDQSVDSQQLKRSVEQFKLAWEAIDRGRPRQADEILKRMVALHPNARWTKDALKQIAAAEEAIESLRGGPLGLFATGKSWLRGDSPTEAPMENRGVGASPTRNLNHVGERGRGAHGTEESDLPTRFLIQVDGAGTFVVVRQPLVTLGPISSSRVPDVALVAEPGAPVATIERTDDDYFVRSAMLQVNDKPTTSKLLMSGDRIALSPRCRMTFTQPNPASTTAVLDLTGARFPRGDVRRVVLLDRDIIIGPGSATHIRCDTLMEPVVLHLRGGRLVCESKTQVNVNGHPMDRVAGIPLGAHVDLGNVSFVITRG
jgi:hypothetical protein